MSFDVQALNTSISIDRALVAVKDRLERDDTWCEKTPLSVAQAIELQELCLRSTCFTFRNQFYMLINGIAMGSPVSSVVGDIMKCFEERALGSAAQLQRRLEKRYVDDVSSVVLKRMVDALLEHLNEMDANIGLTMEQERMDVFLFLTLALEEKVMG